MKIRGPQDYLGQTLREQIQRAEDRAAALEEKLRLAESRPKRVIDISPVNSDIVYLVVAARTGVIYTAQTAGGMCHHPELEGYIVPLFPMDLKRAKPVLDEPMQTCRDGRVASEILCIHRNDLYNWHGIELEIDWSYMSVELPEGEEWACCDPNMHSQEAWIWVKGKFCKDNNWNDCEEDFRGVLVYENSD